MKIKFRAKMKKEFSLPNAGFDFFTLKDLMSGRYDFDNYENWEQFTGLKDKNKNGIYEGDIVKHTKPFKEHNQKQIFIVEWSNDIIGCKAGFNFKRTEENGFTTAYEVNDLEIIGNIHENPELIK